MNKRGKGNKGGEQEIHMHPGFEVSLEKNRPTKRI